MMTFRSTLGSAILAATLLALTACVPVSVEGPCTATSNSTYTLSVDWWMSEGSIAVQLPDKVSSHVVSLRKSASQNRAGARNLAVRPDAAGDSYLISIDIPVGWTVSTATWEGTINGSAANGTATTPVAPPYCPEVFGPVRDGYVRTFFLITPGVTMDASSFGRLNVTYSTGVLETGVYYPTVIGTPEGDGSGCVDVGMAFHRVTVGSPTFVDFDLTSSLNRDVVVNTGDVTQDGTYLTLNESLSFVTETLSNSTEGVVGFPDDGLVTIAGAQLLFFAGANVPECMPDKQTAISDSDNGVNAWVPANPDDTLTFNVPQNRYAEIQIYVTPGSLAFSGSPTPEEMLRNLEVTFHYTDSSTSMQDGTMPVAGLPLFFPPGALGMPATPAFTMALSPLVPSDGSAAGNGSTSGVAGLAAVLVTPDPTKILQSITIRPYVPAFPEGIVASTGPRAQAEGDTNEFAFYGAAGMALPAVVTAPDLVTTKTVLTVGQVVTGSPVTWRVTVTNQGDGASGAVTVTDTLPAQVSYVSATPSTGSCSQLAGTVTCNLGVLAPAASATIDIVATVNAAGAISNTATATTTGDSNNANNAGSVTVTAAAANVPAVPALSTYAIALMAALLAFAAAMRMRL